MARPYECFWTVAMVCLGIPDSDVLDVGGAEPQITQAREEGHPDLPTGYPSLHPYPLPTFKSSFGARPVQAV